MTDYSKIADSVIKDWELITFNHKNQSLKIVIGTIVEEYKDRDFDADFWVCSTQIIQEDWEAQVVHTRNTRYLLLGKGESHTTSELNIIPLLRSGLDFRQAMGIVKNDTPS